MKADVVVIIPVYNAFKQSLDCLESVVRHTSNKLLIVVLDDASPIGQFLDYFQSHASLSAKNSKNVVIKRFVNNAGYVRSVNFGLRYAEQIIKLNNYYLESAVVELAPGQADLILLNSDTLVTANWVEKLQRAAYSKTKIATVTPYTNNGILASFPRFAHENNLPIDLTLDHYAALIEEFASRNYPDLPTSMGFCNYIPRHAIEVLGYYNEEAFGLGNGEENDYSMRAIAAGYHNILDDATFIYHIGEQSFADKKAECSNKNLEILKEMHPHYLDSISKFCSRDPYKPQRLKTLDGIINKLTIDQPRVLHILHNGPYQARGEILGGTELHVQDLIENIESCSHWSLVSRANCFYLTAHVNGLEREYILDKSNVSLQKIIKAEYFSLIHVHHTLWFDRADLLTALKQHGNYIYAVHDYGLVCPRNHFLTPEKRLCNTRECVQSCGINREEINSYRHQARQISQGAKSLVCFSDSSADAIENVIGLRFNNWVKIRHGIKKSEVSEINNLIPIKEFKSFKSFKILLLGEIAEHKGRSLLLDLIDSNLMKELPDVKIEWHILGSLVPEIQVENLTQHGRYQRSELKNKINNINPDLFLMISTCPETYSLTLDEALNAGLPALVSNLGAPAERVREYGVGWVFDQLTVESVFAEIKKIISNPAEYNQVKQRVKDMPIFSTTQESQYYIELYGEVLTYKDLVISKSVTEVLKHFQKLDSLREPEHSKSFRFIGRLANKLIYILDSYGLRYKVQNLIYKILPSSLVYRIKAARVG